MKKQYNKLVCGTIIVSLITISLTGCGLKERDVASSVETERLTEVVSEGLKGSSIKSGKDETVYVSLNQDGSVDNITVTDVLKNFEGGEVQDQSDLCEIQNVKGDEVYKVNGNKILWDYTGSNITYQGKATNELPIGVTITYELDGKEIPLDKVAGTSGKLRIIYEFENNTASKKSESVPFLIASGLILSKTKCTDVIIDHGKVIEEGNNYIVVGYAMPGVLDSMESFEIDMTVQDYEQDMGLLIALPDVLNELPIEDINIEEISSKVDELSDVSNQLVDGTEVIDEGVGKLKDGSSDLKVGGNSLVSGMKDTKEGAFQAKKGSSDIKLGAKDLNDATMKLVKGSKRIQNGANDIKDNLKVLSEGTVKAELGSKQVSEGLTTLKNSLATFKTSSETAFAGISSLATGAKGVDDAVAGLVSGATTIDSSLSTIASGLKTVDSYMTNSENGLVTGSNVVALGVDALIDTFKSSVSSIGEQQKAIMDNVAVQTGPMWPTFTIHC